jgi:hypothetical protein
LSFDYIKGRKPLAPYKDDTQFRPLAEELARQAVTWSQEIESQLSDFRHSADTLIALDAQPPQRGGWPSFNAAIASGMAGDMAVAQPLFKKAYEPLVASRPDFRKILDPYRAAIKEKSAFVNFITEGINAERGRYKLGKLKNGASA